MIALLLGCSGPRGIAAQDVRADTARSAPRGAELLIPLSGLLVPGAGQYIHGAWGPGLGYTASAVGGYALYAREERGLDTRHLPRDGDGQLATSGLFLASGASYLSAYDAFARGIRDLQREGKYRFLTGHAPVGDLLTAPFDPAFLGRWTTWAHLAWTGVIVAVVLDDREPGVAYRPLVARDVGFATALSLSAGIGEEAAFRGWLLPLLHQNTAERFWLSNALQAALFGAGHIGGAGRYSALIGGWALYEGWLTRRNGWSVRESIFHHFWYDLAVVTATFLTDRRVAVALSFPVGF